MPKRSLCVALDLIVGIAAERLQPREHGEDVHTAQERPEERPGHPSADACIVVMKQLGERRPCAGVDVVLGQELGDVDLGEQRTAAERRPQRREIGAERLEGLRQRPREVPKDLRDAEALVRIRQQRHQHSKRRSDVALLSGKLDARADKEVGVVAVLGGEEERPQECCVAVCEGVLQHHPTQGSRSALCLLSPGDLFTTTCCGVGARHLPGADPLLECRQNRGEIGGGWKL